MKYPDGEAIQNGDRVRFDESRSAGVIRDVVEAERTAELGVDTPGIMIESASSGLVYMPSSRFRESHLALEGRGSPVKLNLKQS